MIFLFIKSTSIRPINDARNMGKFSQFWSNSYESLKATGSAIVQTSKKTLAQNHDKLVPLAITAAAVGGAIFLICKSRVPRPIANSPSTNSIACGVGIVRLPAETRVQIWRLLAYKDVLQLRLVSSALKDDIDTLVGLRLTLNKTGKPEQYEFAKRVALQRARIISVEDSIDPRGFFYDAYLMKKLEVFDKYSPIPVWSISKLLKNCVNLTHLKLRLFHTMTSELNEISRILICSVLGKLVNLVHLEFVRHLSRPLPHLRAKIVPTKFYACPKKLVVFVLEAPELSDTAVYNWKYLLEQQTKLRNIVFSVGAIHWDFFERIIPKNPSLAYVKLVGLKNTHVDGEDFRHFDWSIFRNCRLLKDIYICGTVTPGPYGTDLLSARNFSLLPCENIEKVCFTRVILTGDDVRRIYGEMVQLKRGYLDHIGDEGMAMAAIVSSETNRFEVDGFEEEGNDGPWWSEEPNGLYVLAFHSLALLCGVVGMTMYANTIEAYSASIVERQNQPRDP